MATKETAKKDVKETNEVKEIKKEVPKKETPNKN